MAFDSTLKFSAQNSPLISSLLVDFYGVYSAKTVLILGHNADCGKWMKLEQTRKVAVKRRYVPDLISDMAECDGNYIRLLRLFPNMHHEDSLEFGVQGTMEDGAIVTIKITERCPYTTMLQVKVASEEDKPWIKWPSLEVRVYHDVNSAEVVRFERHRNFKYRYYTPNARMFQPDEKSQINRFFGELLTFCLKYGHVLSTLGLGKH